MDDKESLEEFCEDFSTPGPDAAALMGILAQAHPTGDPEMRRLVKEVEFWRFIAPILLDRIAPVGTPIDESDPSSKLARFQIRGEGAIGAKPAG
jgi:hypothetical protein